MAAMAKEAKAGAGRISLRNMGGNGPQRSTSRWAQPSPSSRRGGGFVHQNPFTPFEEVGLEEQPEQKPDVIGIHSQPTCCLNETSEDCARENDPIFDNCIPMTSILNKWTTM